MSYVGFLWWTLNAADMFIFTQEVFKGRLFEGKHFLCSSRGRNEELDLWAQAKWCVCEMNTKNKTPNDGFIDGVINFGGFKWL